MKILDLLKITDRKGIDGIWLSGISGQGEFKKWWKSGILYQHGFYKNYERVGEYKDWHDNGQLWEQSFWKDGRKHGVYKEWSIRGRLVVHSIWEEGKHVRSLLQ